MTNSPAKMREEFRCRDRRPRSGIGLCLALSVLLLSTPVHAQEMVRLDDGTYRLTELGYQRLKDEIHRLDQQAARLEAENAELRKALEQKPPELPSTPTALLVAGGLGLLLGAVAGAWVATR